jgi:hypothetical protein
VAGDETLPVTAVTLHFDQIYAVSDIARILSDGFPATGGITVHSIDRLNDHDWRIQVHAAPADFRLAEQRVKDVLSKALIEHPEDVQVDDAPTSITRETLKGIGRDVSSIVTGATATVGTGVSNILGGGSLGSIIFILGAGVVVVGLVYLGRRK